MSGASSKVNNKGEGGAKDGATDSTANHSNYIDLDELTSDTVKKNPNMEFSYSELLRILSYMEGELQAREVVIATLQSENLKQFIYASRCQPEGPNDPQAALYRDNLAAVGKLVTRQHSAFVAQSDQVMKLFARQQLESLENAVQQQRQTHMKLIGVIKESEEKHKYLLHELDEEKKKHERDTAQGDDITYGLEIERTRLRQDLETEKQTTKRLEKDVKKGQETLEAERSRQKTIVLLLLAERKRIIMKYIEERKRSEDLAQILSEEKQRSDSIAEGLEEESKKSLRMEAELEKQLQTFDKERTQLNASLAHCEAKVREQSHEIAQLKAENEFIRKQQQRIAAGPPQLPQKSGRHNQDANEDNASAGPLASSVTKVVQPTATVSSVPVSGPTTGIARSISPGQTLRQQQVSSIDGSPFAPAAKVAPRKLSNVSAPIGAPSAHIATSTIGHQSQIQQPQQQILNKSGGVPQLVSTIKKTPAALPPGRGVPPPIPPNKPVVPPKRESSVTRMGITPGVASVITTAAGMRSGEGGTSAPTPIATGVAVATSGSATAEEII